MQPFDRASGDLDGFLFGGADEALRAHVTRHQTAMGALSDMMVRLRSVVSDLSPHAPIVVEGRRAADLGGDWSRFDETIFDVEHVATADCAIRVPVDPPAAHAFMFDADTNPPIPVAFVAPMMREGAPL